MTMIMPYFNMVSRVTIGAVTFPHISSCRIEETITEPGNKATIVIPVNYNKLDGKSYRDYIKAGDPVTIELGYNDMMAVEFTGYVRRIGAEAPCVIECDDHWYPLMQNNWAKTYQNTTLKAILQEIAAGYKIDCPDLSLSVYKLDNISTYETVRKIQQDFGLFARIVDDTIVVGFSYEWDVSKTNRWLYHRQKNVRRSDLVWKEETDFKVQVNVHSRDKDGKKRVTSYGNGVKGASHMNLHINGISETDAQKIARARYQKYVYNGYTGSFTGWGLPRAHAGDSVELQDGLLPERNGVYLLQGVTIEYGPQGYRRTNKVAYKIA